VDKPKSHSTFIIHEGSGRLTLTVHDDVGNATTERIKEKHH